MHIATVLKAILPLALLVDGTVSAPTENERATATAEATVQVYAAAGCHKNDQETKTYQLFEGKCVDAPPTSKADGHFLSYTATINGGATASSCFLDVYPDKNCTGNYSGFQSAPKFSSGCQNVLQGFTGLKETYGAKSMRINC